MTIFTFFFLSDNGNKKLIIKLCNGNAATDWCQPCLQGEAFQESPLSLLRVCKWHRLHRQTWSPHVNNPEITTANKHWSLWAADCLSAQWAQCSAFIAPWWAGASESRGLIKEELLPWPGADVRLNIQHRPGGGAGRRRWWCVYVCVHPQHHKSQPVARGPNLAAVSSQPDLLASHC